MASAEPGAKGPTQRTGGGKAKAPAAPLPERRRAYQDATPVTEEVAAAALFLAQDSAQFVSGVGLNVDGGAIVQF